MKEKERLAKKNKKEVNKKANILLDLFVFDLIIAVTLGLAFFLFSVAIKNLLPLKIYLPIILLVIIISYSPLKKDFERQDYIAELFATEEYIEVVPLPLPRYNFLYSIKTDTTKFYATEKNIYEYDVYIQISADEKLKFLEAVPSVYFENYYQIIKPE